ncbi:neprilysin-2 isoform X2 [Schistocerca serialis cubense]|uniref:neprilysin-2 isoform X2 n=1 Tax=Schistocerca serialis cubense TaxID=2023355 RepID=UPI00214F3283|nr:neprilysin-2 isoform X2 [Schistocerca serialis cubense]
MPVAKFSTLESSEDDEELLVDTVSGNPTWWRRRTAMERGLTLVATVALLAAVALAISLGVLVARRQQQSESLMPMAMESRGNVSAGAAQTPSSRSGAQSLQDVCLTPGCVHAASEVLDKLDPSVDPCDDFYQYSCGSYLRTTNIPDDKSSVNTFSAINDQLLEKLRTAIEEEDTEGVVPRSFQLARKLYSACMNKSLIESRGLAPLQRVLKEELGGWPAVEGDSWDEASFDWRQSVYRFRRAGYSVDYFIDFSVATDARNSTHRSINLDQASLGLSREFLVKGPSDKLVDAYYQYQVDLAVLLGADRARAERELRQSLEFEITLANISLPSEKRRNVTQLYNPRTVEQLQREYPSVPWLEYLQKLLPPHVTISNDELIVVSVPSYLKSLEVLLSHTPKRVMANYVMWRAAGASVTYMTEELRNRQLKYHSALSGKTEREPRWKECVDIVAGGLSLSVGSIYVRKYFKEEAKKAALEMVDDIRQEFLHILQEVDWMDEGTRKKGLEKAKSMAVHIAYPDELLDDNKLDQFYEKLDVSPTLYLESVLNLTKFGTNYSFSRLRQPVNKTEWITHGRPAIVNAFYSSIENSIQFPAGILQGAFFSAERPKYMNYGAIGFVIGHEITHGFDDQGRQFDKDGNLVDWWDPVTRDEYLKKAECIISQYGNYTDDQTGMHLNGINTQGENIADNGGIKEAYRAYLALERRNGKSEPRLPALSGLSPRQMFWVSAAQTWCSKYRTEAMRQRITTGVHSPGRFRVLGPLSNRPEFAEDFACPLGSRMNPVQKCQVW